eukprot:TRINITY_DN1499_c0_g2_i1.p1 TRINITY_DN1499_c0_g2~~TRINITY_DN1499_c0_g2_i1.p1  ORF type:complete len:489 (+),score=98.29 TRINITY_DN1499_c0_g2_i1:46-1512(+)
MSQLHEIESSSEDEDDKTKPRKGLQMKPGGDNLGNAPCIPERKAWRKPRRGLRNGITVMEAPAPQGEEPSPEGRQRVKRRLSSPEKEPDARRQCLQARRQIRKEEADAEAVLERLASSFAEDYLLSPTCAKSISYGLLLKLMHQDNGENSQAQTSSRRPPTTESILSEVREGWLRRLKLGFSLLVEGIGSKRLLLEAFGDHVLMPWGAYVARFDAFDASGSLPTFFRELLSNAYPNYQRSGGSSPESLAASIRAARSSEQYSARPLAIIVHNMELLPPNHQAALSTLATDPKIFLVASVDNISAPGLWTGEMVKNFNFSREEVDTLQGFSTELSRKYPDGVPAWSDLSANHQHASKASIGVVLRSLTSNHRELCEVIAKHQLEEVAEGGRLGLSMPDLLQEANDRMICSNLAKLRGLLNELKDHEVVTQKAGPDGSTLILMPFKDKILEKLAQGEIPEDEDIEERQEAEEDEEDDEDDELDMFDNDED